MPEEKTIPSNERITNLCLLLSKQFQKEDLHRRYAPIKKVLTLIGIAGALGLTLLAPGIAPITKQIINSQTQKDQDSWKQYNPYFLKRTIQRLHKQKMVEISEHNGQQCIILTVNGKRKILKYALTEMAIEKPKTWDGQWRLIIYDIEDNHKKMRDLFRSQLKMLGFFQLQKSVWLYPYPCDEQISFLREYDGVGNEVMYIVTNILEDDTPYREYFGII
ncbi:MAG: hypothetical protein V1917_03100 [Candidatus Gottesmanbacteria bacterium]